MTTDVPPGELRDRPAKIFESSRVASVPDGWITTKGVFFPCTPQEHDECAKYLLKTHKSFIESLLVENKYLLNENGQHDMINSRYGTIDTRAGYNPRTILKAAGFALLSGNQLSESNLPESLSFKQMEFARRNNLVFTPKSGQLDFEAYHSFQKAVMGSEGVKDLLEQNEAVKKFLADPTKSLSIQDNVPLANKVLVVLTEGFTAGISLKVSKGFVVWRRLNIPSDDNIFLQYEYHYHGGDCTPERENFIFLTNKQSIKEFLHKIRYGPSPEGDLSALN